MAIICPQCNCELSIRVNQGKIWVSSFEHPCTLSKWRILLHELDHSSNAQYKIENGSHTKIQLELDKLHAIVAPLMIMEDF